MVQARRTGYCTPGNAQMQRNRPVQAPLGGRVYMTVMDHTR
jgi:hypothetical protein